MKICPGCKQELPLSEFMTKNHTMRGTCKPCMTKVARERAQTLKAKNPDLYNLRAQENYLKRRTSKKAYQPRVKRYWPEYVPGYLPPHFREGVFP